MAYKKLKLNNVLQARQTIGEAYELANNTKLEIDKMAVLKEGYITATSYIQDNLRRPQKLFFQNINKLQDKIHQKRRINLVQIKPNMKYDKQLKTIELELNKYRRSLIVSNSEYQDDIVIIDKAYRVHYLTLSQLDQYIKVYQNYLQRAYKALRKPI